MENYEQTEFTEETALSFFSRFLDNQNWYYRRPDTRPLLSCDFNGKEALWDFQMSAHKTVEGLFVLTVNSFIPNKAAPERRIACAELFSRINFELFLGCFEMDHEVGDIRFRTSVILPAEDITDGIVEHLLRSNLVMVDQRLKQIMTVLYSNTTPAQILKPNDQAGWPASAGPQFNGQVPSDVGQESAKNEVPSDVGQAG